VDNSVCRRGYLGVVGDHENRLPKSSVQVSNHIEDGLRILRVQITRRLIRQEYLGFTNDGASDGHTLLFTA
jgi:hypothetical protein